MNTVIDIDGLLLRQWNIADATQLALIGNDIEIAWNMNDGFPNPFTLEKAREFIENANKSNNILLAIDVFGIVIGSIGAFFNESDYTETTIAYFIGKKYWNNGYGTKAIKALVKYLLEDRKVQKIYAEPFSRNISSRQILEKNGFRNIEIVKNGSIKSHNMIDIVKYEYIKMS